MMIEHEDTDYPVCPYCGEEDVDFWDRSHWLIHDGDWEYARCIACNEKYELIMRKTTTFITLKTGSK